MGPLASDPDNAVHLVPQFLFIPQLGITSDASNRNYSWPSRTVEIGTQCAIFLFPFSFPPIIQFPAAAVFKITRQRSRGIANQFRVLLLDSDRNHESLQGISASSSCLLSPMTPLSSGFWCSPLTNAGLWISLGLTTPSVYRCCFFSFSFSFKPTLSTLPRKNPK